jgi:hypothetical protein
MLSLDQLSLDVIAERLEQHGQRATYGAVARLLGRSPRALLKGRDRAPRFSWIVNRTTGLPTGYPVEQIDPRVPESGAVLCSDAELREWLE